MHVHGGLHACTCTCTGNCCSTLTCDLEGLGLRSPPEPCVRSAEKEAMNNTIIPFNIRSLNELHLTHCQVFTSFVATLNITSCMCTYSIGFIQLSNLSMYPLVISYTTNQPGSGQLRTHPHTLIAKHLLPTYYLNDLMANPRRYGHTLSHTYNVCVTLYVCILQANPILS